MDVVFFVCIVMRGAVGAHVWEVWVFRHAYVVRGIRWVGGVCEICMCLARGGVGGEWIRIGFVLYQSCRNRGSVGSVFVLRWCRWNALDEPSVQSCCTLLTSASYRVFVGDRYRKFRFVCVWLSDLEEYHQMRTRLPKTVNRASNTGGGRYDTICAAVCNHWNSSTFT